MSFERGDIEYLVADMVQACKDLLLKTALLKSLLTEEILSISWLIWSKPKKIYFWWWIINAGSGFVHNQNNWNIVTSKLYCAFQSLISFLSSKLRLLFQDIYSISLSPLVVVVYQSRVIPQIVRFPAFEVTFATIERKRVGCFQVEVIKTLLHFNF